MKEYSVYCNKRRVRYVGTSTHPETIKAETKESAMRKAKTICNKSEIVGNITLKEIK